MAYPLNSEFPFLIASGLKTIVNITEYSAEYAEIADTNGITVHNIPVEDLTPPSHRQIVEFLDIVDTAETVGYALLCTTIWLLHGTVSKLNICRYCR